VRERSVRELRRAAWPLTAVLLAATWCAACGPKPAPASPLAASPVPVVRDSGKPKLLGALVRGYDSADSLRGGVGLEVGDTAIDFVLKDTQGDEHSLSGLLADKPVVMVLGSFTCPVFRGSCAATEALYGLYGDRVNFIVVYTIEAHPVGARSPYSSGESLGTYSVDLQGSPIYQPATYQERLLLARKTVAEAGLTVPVLVDEMDNPVWCTYGAAPNAAYLIGTDGSILAAQRWYEPRAMESAILACTKNT
jgi:hypothetical protein